VTWISEEAFTFEEKEMPDKVRRQYYDRMRTAVFVHDPENREPDFAVCEKWSVPRTEMDQFYEVKMGLQRLDLISHRYYGTPFLYWLIALANDIQEPWEELPIGTLLRIPNLEHLHAIGFFDESGEGATTPVTNE